MSERMDSSGRVTLVDCTDAAADLLEQIENNQLDPATVEARAVAACKRLFGLVGSGPADPLWSTHADITKQFLGAGGLTADEIAEWLALQRRREAGGDQ